MQRDFRFLGGYRDEMEYVKRNPDTFCKLFSTGSGMFVKWFLFHSAKHGKCFIVWKQGDGDHFGFRVDTERISMMDG
jgi:hypothetical protein